jgi:hypothetical protein
MIDNPHSQGSKILLLGSGFVAGPLVDYFAKNAAHRITIGFLLFFSLCNCYRLNIT